MDLGAWRAMAEPRVVTVPAERLQRWLDGFVARHGHVEVSVPGALDRAVLVASDGAQASCEVPFPPLAGGVSAYGGVVEHVTRPRRFAVVLVRRGGYAVGIVDGDRLVESKVGTRHVQSRTAAGGWSQQRYARRRANQSAVLVEAVVEQVLRLVLASGVEAVVGGGDRLLLDAVRTDRRLASLAGGWTPRRLDVPDPRRQVLDEAVVQARSVRITLTDP